MHSSLLKRNTIANFAGGAWSALMGLAFVPVYIHYLGIEAWGLVGFMTMLQAWLTLLDMGLTPTLSREMARFYAGAHSAQSIRDLLRSLEYIYGGIALLVVVIVGAIAPILTRHWLHVAQLPIETVSRAIAIMGLVLAARMVVEVYRGAIQGMQRQVWLNGAQSILVALRWGGAAAVVAWIRPSIEVFFAWQGMISLLTVAIFAGQTYRLLPRSKRPAHFSTDAIKRVRHFAGGMAATTLLAIMLTQVDKLLLSKLTSLEVFGYYTLAATAASALYFLATPISNAILPRLTELVAKSEEKLLIDTYHRASQWLAALLIPAALVMAVFSGPLIYVWTGNVGLVVQASPLLTLLALGTLCNGLMHIPYSTQLAYGWTGLAVKMNIVAVIIIVPAIIWAVPRFGAIGAAWAWLALNAGYVLIGMHFMHRRLLPTEKWRWYRQAILTPLIVGAFVALALRWGIHLPQTRASLSVALAGIALVVTSAVFFVVPASREDLRRQYKALWG